MGSHLNSNLDQKRNMRWRFAQHPYPPHALPTTGPRNDVRTDDSAFSDLLNGILKSLVLFQGSDLKKNQGCLVDWPTLKFNRLGPMSLKSLRSSRLFRLLIKLRVATSSASGQRLSKSSSTGIQLCHVTSAQLAVGTSTRGTPIILKKLNIDQRSPSRTLTTCIKFLYLLKPARDACIKVIGEDSQILTADWLLLLNENNLLVESDLASLAELMRLAIVWGYLIKVLGHSMWLCMGCGHLNMNQRTG